MRHQIRVCFSARVWDFLCKVKPELSCLVPTNQEQLWQVTCNRRGLMDVSYVTAVAALGGAALGGFTSFASSWTTLRIQMKADQSANSKSRRQKLYKEFIDEASKIYGDALIHSTLELSGLIGLYSLISRMRSLF